MKIDDLKRLTPEQAQKADFDRFYVKDAKGFSPEKNKAIIEKTIQDYEALRAKKAKRFDDHYGERADAVVTYLKHLDQGGKGESNLEKYFGKRMLAYLRGQEIRDKLMHGMTVVSKDGSKVLKPGGV